MKYFFSCTYLILLFFFVDKTHGQSTNLLSEVKTLNTQHQYKIALKKIKNYAKTHQDLYTLWIYGQTLFYAKKYAKAEEIYKKGILKYPNNEVLKLDFVTNLISIEKLDEAELLLESLIKYENKYSFFVLKTLSQIYYWQGKYDESLVKIRNAIKINPQDSEAKILLKKIELSRKNWLQTYTNLTKDNQPLTKFYTELKGGFYINDVVTLGTKFKLPYFNTQNNRYLNLGVTFFNTLTFHKTKLKTYTELGFDKTSLGTFNFNGSLQITKHLYKHLNLTLNATYQPYLLTSNALKINLMEFNYGITFSYEHPNGFIGRASYNINEFYSEKNKYYTKSIWVLSPKLKFSKLTLRLGYGFSYSDTHKNTFTPKASLASIVEDSWDASVLAFNPLTNIDGYYDPFFSPSKQLINSAITSIETTFMKTFTLRGSGSFGFYSTTNNPSLNLEFDTANPSNLFNGAFIKTYFTKERYFPLDINASINYNLNTKLNLMIEYKYQSTQYYNSNLLGLRVNYLF